MRLHEVVDARTLTLRSLPCRIGFESSPAVGTFTRHNHNLRACVRGVSRSEEAWVVAA